MRLPPKPGPGSTTPREPAFMSGGPRPKKQIKREGGATATPEEIKKRQDIATRLRKKQRDPVTIDVTTGKPMKPVSPVKTPITNQGPDNMMNAAKAQAKAQRDQAGMPSDANSLAQQAMQRPGMSKGGATKKGMAYGGMAKKGMNKGGMANCGASMKPAQGKGK